MNGIKALNYKRGQSGQHDRGSSPSVVNSQHKRVNLLTIKIKWITSCVLQSVM